MAKVITGEQSVSLQQRLSELACCVDGGAVDFEPTMIALRQLIDGQNFILLDSKDAGLVNGYFSPIGSQIMRVRMLNQDREWGLTAADFAVIEQSVPEWPKSNLVAVTLVPYLPDGYEMSGALRTFCELWQASNAMHPMSTLWSGFELMYRNVPHLCPEICHPAKDKPVLRWEIIELGHGNEPKARDPKSQHLLPHAGVLAAAALHPAWVKAMDGNTVPYVWIPGYYYKPSGGSISSRIPLLGYDKTHHRIWLSCPWEHHLDSTRAKPSFYSR